MTGAFMRACGPDQASRALSPRAHRRSVARCPMMARAAVRPRRDRWSTPPGSAPSRVPEHPIALTRWILGNRVVKAPGPTCAVPDSGSQTSSMKSRGAIDHRVTDAGGIKARRSGLGSSESAHSSWDLNTPNNSASRCPSSTGPRHLLGGNAHDGRSRTSFPRGSSPRASRLTHRAEAAEPLQE